MNEKEWQAYVNRLAVGGHPIPKNMINDYNNWVCRSTVGRALYWMDDVEGAMAVLATVLPEEPNMEDATERGMSDVEHKVLCLRDVADIVWTLAKNDEAALAYLEVAYYLSRA